MTTGFFQGSKFSSRERLSTIPQCGKCGLSKTCNSPKMPVTGEGLKKVLIVAEAPGRNEDEKGIQLIGIAGMNYASFVESKGYNVISYQADVCIVDLAMYLETLEVIEQGSAAKMEETFIP